MAGAAPNFSVTGFQLSEVKKPNPKAFHAGSEPMHQREHDAGKKHEDRNGRSTG